MTQLDTVLNAIIAACVIGLVVLTYVFLRRTR